MEYFNVNRFLSVQIKNYFSVQKNIFSVKKCPVSSLLDYQSTHMCMQLDAPFFTCFTHKKKIICHEPMLIKCVFVSDYCNDGIEDIPFNVTC